MLLIGSSQEAARCDGEPADLRKVGSHAKNADVLQQVIAMAHIGVGAKEGSDLADGAHAGLELVEFVRGDQRALLGFYPGVFTGDNPEAVQDEDVGAEIGDAVGDVEIQPGDHAHYRDQRRYGQNDSEQRQETPQFMGAQGVQREAERLRHGDKTAAEAAML